MRKTHKGIDTIKMFRRDMMRHHFLFHLFTIPHQLHACQGQPHFLLKHLPYSGKASFQNRGKGLNPPVLVPDALGFLSSPLTPTEAQKKQGGEAEGRSASLTFESTNQTSPSHKKGTQRIQIMSVVDLVWI